MDKSGMAKVFYEQTARLIARYIVQELGIRPGPGGHWQVVSATSGPRVLTLALAVNPKYASKIASMSEALSMAARLDREASIRVGRGRRGTLAIEVPKPESLWYNIGVRQLPRRRGLAANVGVDVEHRPTFVDLANPLTPHVLVAGATGSGKTNVGRLLFHGLASQNGPEQVGFVLIDTCKRGKAWRDFEWLPHTIHTVITEDDEALRALCWAVAEIDRRARGQGSPGHVFVGIDEAQALLDKEIFIRPIGDIARVGREFDVHLVLIMQDPTAKQLGDASIKHNLTCRLVGKVTDANAAVVATGQADSGAHKLAGVGDMLGVWPDGMRRLTAALLTEQDVARLRSTCSAATAVRHLDLEEYEDPEHVAAQADVRSVAGFDGLETALSIIAAARKRGRPWLQDVVEGEMGQRPGGSRSGRLLEWGREVFGFLKQYQHLMEN